MMSHLSIYLPGIAVLAVGAVLIPGARAQAPDRAGAPAVVRQAGKLVLHQPVERELGRGQTDVFTVDVAAGQFVHVAVEKKGVDAVLVLTDPEGKARVTADSPNGRFGPEPASLIAERGGAYQVQMAKSPRSSETGRYRIELTDLHAPTEQDRRRLQAETEFFAAVANDRAQDREKWLQAVVGYRRAVALWHSLRDDAEEALCLHLIGVIHNDLGEKQKAVDYFNQELPLWRAMGNREREAVTLSNIGVVYSEHKEFQRALDYFHQALPLWRAIGNRGREGMTLNNIGSMYGELGENRKALDYFNQALTLSRAMGDHASEADRLNNIGLTYSHLGERQKALDFYDQALPMWRAVEDRPGEAGTLLNIGIVYVGVGELHNALDCFTQGLQLYGAVRDRAGEVASLIAIGNVYSELGETHKALDSYNEGLLLARASGDNANVAATLGDIGNVYSDIGEHQKALDYYNQALPLDQAVGYPADVAATLVNIGGVYSAVGDQQKALEYLNQALVVERAVGYPADVAATLNNIGEAYRKLGEKQKALGYYTQALQVARAASDSPHQGLVLFNLMRYWQAEHPGLAIFFGKQAVNQYQDIRRKIQGLDPQVQRTYLGKVTSTYRLLADLLIAQGRLSEAEQILSLLKEQEYFDYVRRDATEASSVNGRADLNLEEAEWYRRYREIADRIVAMGTERGDLVTKRELTPGETQHLGQLERDLAVGNMAFEKFLGELPQNFSAKPVPLRDLREAEGIMEDLRELPSGTVAIYTLIGEDKFRAILRTADVQKAYEYPIAAADLNRKVAAFRQVVQDPRLDPRPAAQELYKILIAPMAEDLRQAKAQTLMWSLDGTLRYLPLAALYDGKQYLIEQYRVSVMTLASNARLKDRPDAEWKGAAFGVTKASEEAPALPWVSAELAGIIATKPGDGGAMAGEVALDGEFTQQTMRQTLLKHYPVVHIASHFQFRPGNETQSFLLLGDGGHLSLAELKTSANLFGGVQVLTLSACDTGIGDGTEVEGFGTLAQRQGAKAVVASLWPVADESTSVLMPRFYRIRQSSPGKTKLEALREAQVELLRGEAKLPGAAASPARAMIYEPRTAKPPAAPFTVDPKAPYAHPFYWAPFFLMGNWL